MITKFILSMILFPIAFEGTPQNNDKDVAAVVERFRKAVVDADGATLKKLLADNLSYGHSDGHIEGREELIDKFSDGRYDFVTMDLTEQTIVITDNIAVVRNKLDGKTNDNGKPNEAHLYVLMVWQKTKDGWKLLARQAVKQALPSK
jgi:ketosteroid isomerase-like protein